MDAASPFRARIPRRRVWAVVIALAAAALAAAWIVNGRGGRSSVPGAPAPSRVALVYARPPGARTGFIVRREVIYAASPTDGRPRRLAVGASPLLSPDGNRIAYISGPLAHPAEIRLIGTLGGPPRAVGVSGEPLGWSPNSRLLAVRTAHGLAIVDARTLRVTPIRVPEAAGAFSFSPDGTMLAFEHSTGSGIDVYTVRRTDGAIRRLTDDHRSGYPLWGPGGEIAFERFGPDRCANCHGDVWVMNDDGGDQHQLTRTHAGIYPAAWSADGRRLLAAYPATHNGKLYAVDANSGATHALTPFVGDLFAQGLSRDGRTVLAAIGCGGTASPFGLIETIPFAGGRPSVIVRGPCRASSNF
jgi:hypothetical protein